VYAPGVVIWWARLYAGGEFAVLRRLLIIGAGGHAISVSDVADSSGYTTLGFVDDTGTGISLLGLVATDYDLDDHVRAGGLIAIAIGDNYDRERVWNSRFAHVPLDQFPALVHPSAVVSSRAQLGPGCVIHAGVVVGPLANVGAHSILNSASVLDHESVLKDFASLAPGAVVGGRSTIGERSAVGLGASVKHGISVGDDTIIGANSYVHRDISDELVAYGSPARVVRSREPGGTYL
jgi:sugar O-acyltransferase (sialic acid O-acetyltransferase NeuD family)